VDATEQVERGRPSRAAPASRRLGLVEYTLLALIAASVGITLVMAIVNP
jgi:hypothetical protein